MERFEYLVNKRNRYLGLFHKVINKLESLNGNIAKQRAKSLDRQEREEKSIKEAHERVKEEQKGIIFLDEQTQMTDTQIKKIRSLVEPTLPEKKEPNE